MLIVDIDIVIDISYGNVKTIEVLARYELNYELAISSITRYEVLVGCRNKQEMRAIYNY